MQRKDASFSEDQCCCISRNTPSVTLKLFTLFRNESQAIQQVNFSPEKKDDSVFRQSDAARHSKNQQGQREFEVSAESCFHSPLSVLKYHQRPTSRTTKEEQLAELLEQRSQSFVEFSEQQMMPTPALSSLSLTPSLSFAF